MESDLTQCWKYTDPWCCKHYYTHAKLRQFTNGMPTDWISSIQGVLENIKIKWQDRIPDTEVLKTAGMQSVHTLLKLAVTMDRTSYSIECLMNVCQRKSSMENYKSRNAPMVIRRRDTRIPSKAHLVQHTNRVMGTDCTGLSKWQGLIKMGARNTKQKESAKPNRNVRSGKPELRHHQQSFLPPICNRQFRAKIGLFSYLRTQTITLHAFD